MRCSVRPAWATWAASFRPTIRAAGWQVLSAHVVAVAEEPRLAPHLDAMAHTMAAALGVADTAVHVGATTTDGMGFPGRGEGVWASATVLLAPI
jgi:2-C-methyl-D-erythritol 2,4-cyclodiphosphate synthase